MHLTDYWRSLFSTKTGKKKQTSLNFDSLILRKIPARVRKIASDVDVNSKLCSLHRSDTGQFKLKLEMWINAQRDGRPAEYRWRPLFNAAKFGWRPLLQCRAVTLPRRETRWNLQGCPKLTNRSQLLVSRSSPYCNDMCGRYCCLTKFFSDCRYVP